MRVLVSLYIYICFSPMSFVRVLSEDKEKEQIIRSRRKPKPVVLSCQYSFSLFNKHIVCRVNDLIVSRKTTMIVFVIDM